MESLRLDGGLGRRIRGSGQVTGRQLLRETADCLVADGRVLRRLCYVLLDFSGVVQLQVRDDETGALESALQAAAVVNPDLLVAAVEPSDGQSAFTGLCRLVVDVTRWELNVFKDGAQGENWLRSRLLEGLGLEDIAFR